MTENSRSQERTYRLSRATTRTAQRMCVFSYSSQTLSSYYRILSKPDSSIFTFHISTVFPSPCPLFSSPSSALPPHSPPTEPNQANPLQTTYLRRLQALRQRTLDGRPPPPSLDTAPSQPLMASPSPTASVGVHLAVKPPLLSERC